MRKTIGGVIFAGLVFASNFGYASEPTEEKLELKDGSTLYLRSDGTSKMVDHHGNRMAMKDGVEMELADGRLVEMKNKVVWITYGPPTKGGVIRKTE
jgi:hypothetical protein